MVTLEYTNLLLHIDIHRQSVKYIINEQSMNINVFFSCLSFFFKLSERERERERERVYKIGYKEKWSQSLLIFFSLMESWGESHFFYGLIDFILFLTLAWRTWVPRVRDVFLSSTTRSTGFGSSARYEPCPTTNFIISFFSLTGRRCHFRF